MLSSSSAAGVHGKMNNNELGEELSRHYSEGPGLWWEAFTEKILPAGDAGLVLDVLSRAIQAFPVDQFRVDPLFLRIWLAFLEAHLYPSFCIMCLLL